MESGEREEVEVMTLVWGWGGGKGGLLREGGVLEQECLHNWEEGQGRLSCVVALRRDTVLGTPWRHRGFSPHMSP